MRIVLITKTGHSRKKRHILPMEEDTALADAWRFRFFLKKSWTRMHWINFKSCKYFIKCAERTAIPSNCAIAQFEGIAANYGNLEDSTSGIALLTFR